MAAPLMQMESPLGPRMRIGGREVDYFCGTSYHTLHGHPDVIEASVSATHAYGVGPGTRADVPPYNELAAELAAYMGCEAITYTVSGYASPLVLLQGLRDGFERVFVDAAAHYSFGDALATLDQPVHYFVHREPDSLAAEMAAHLRPGERAIVASDGIFPSTGAIAPLSDYCKVMEAYDGAQLCIDDAHGIGTVGASGRGTLELQNVEGEGRHVCGTTSKAMGGAGGFVPSTADLACRMRERVRLLAGASPPPPASAAAALAGLRLLRADPGFARRLTDNVVRMRSGLRGLGFAIEDSPVPIVSVSAPRDLTVLVDSLARKGILVKRVAGGGYSDAPAHETLRIAVFSSHAPAQIDRLVEALGALL